MGMTQPKCFLQFMQFSQKFTNLTFEKLIIIGHKNHYTFLAVEKWFVPTYIKIDHESVNQFVTERTYIENSWVKKGSLD